MKNIIPILQVNNKKFILAGDSDSGDLSSGFYNIRDIDLTSFTEANLLEFLEKSYFADFPIEDFKKLILLYADLLPGNITGFIKDILLWEVLDYSKNKIQVSSGDFAAKFLQGSHEDIYELRKLSLTPGELAVAELISLFDIPINMNTASVLSGLSTLEMEDTASSFLRKNIFHPVHLGNTLNFTSAGLKKYIYSDITDKKDRHFAAAQLIKDNIPSFNRVELARQFELSFRFKESYETIKEELTAAEKISAYSYKKKILRKYLSLPLGFDDKREIKTDLASVLYNLSEFRNAEDLVNELLEENLPVEKKDGLLILKGSCLIGAGEFEQGKVLFNELISRIDDVNKIRKLLTETANAEYELNNFDETSSICRKIISAGSEDNLEKAKCFNILGLVAVIRENNPSNALANFDLARNIYEKEGLLFRVAQIEKNMGNIYDMKREYDKAEQHWNKSLEISLSSGNLDLEAKILLNYGIYYFELLRFEDALENYNRALSIFLSLGNSGGQGLVQYNLGEIYLVTCEFEKAARSIESSVKIFNSLKNLNEELESLFLLGKIYYTAGSGDLLDSVIEIMQQKIEDEKSIAKHKINFNFLQQLACLPAANANDSVKLLSAIKEQFLELDDKTNFFFCAVQLINLFIRYGLFNEALLELNDPYFVTLCQENKLNNAEKNYLLALVSLNSGSGGNPVDYLLDAYSFVCESSITELTWKVLFELAGIYFERGNFHKSKEFNNYAVSVLDYIFNIIEENKFKSCVMDYPERKNSYNRLLTMQSSY
jgi:tetratricopeptide (TPR) repeat protein